MVNRVIRLPNHAVAMVASLVATILLSVEGFATPGVSHFKPLAVGNVARGTSIRPTSNILAKKPIQRERAVALRMSKDDEEGEESEKSAWEKLTADFREEGKGGVFEQIMNYAVDVFTVTAGAAVAMCLIFNAFGKIPCI